jgi:hypothetical protein
MRKRYRYDHDLDCLVAIEERPQGPNVISDDVGAGVNGLRHMPSGKMLDSKSAHYRENRARGLEHVGSETNFAVKREAPKAEAYVREVLDAKAQLASNWNGTADRLRRENESRKD